MRHHGLILGLLCAAAPAAAQPAKPAEIEGATRLKTVKFESGFVDDAFAFDGAGGRLVVVRADGAALAEIQVLDLARDALPLLTTDVSAFSANPTAVEPVLGGDRFFVTAHATEDDPRLIAAVLDAKGAVVRKFGPADDIELTTYDGKPVVVTYQLLRKPGKKGERLHHVIAVVSLETGKLVGKKAVLDADETGYIAKKDMRILYFLDGYTRLVALKGGTWDKKEDQRSPDREAWYDVPAGLVSRQVPIADVVAHTRQARLRAEHWNEARFLMVARDLTALKLVDAGDPVEVKLAEPFHHYDPKSLQQQLSADGGFYFTLAIDPVNADAVARKKADVQWLDLYRMEPGASEARRLARLRLDKRDVRWRATREHWAVLTKHVGFDRGGKTLDLFRLGAKN